MDERLKDVLAVLYQLLNERKFEDIAISGATCLTSIKNFNNVEELYECIRIRQATEILIRKNGKLKFTERIRIHNIKGYKLNDKSITFLTKTLVGVGSRAGYRYNVRFD